MASREAMYDEVQTLRAELKEAEERTEQVKRNQARRIATLEAKLKEAEDRLEESDRYGKATNNELKRYRDMLRVRTDERDQRTRALEGLPELHNPAAWSKDMLVEAIRDARAALSKEEPDG